MPTFSNNDGASTNANLANWRQAPFNVWACGNVDKLIPVAAIPAGKPGSASVSLDWDAAYVAVDAGGHSLSFAEALEKTATDGILVLKGGRIAHESYRNGTAETRHILFSVSKSVTGILAGILVGKGLLDPAAPVSRYVPEITASAYGTATVRHVLDMTVGITFVEDYLDTTGAFARYRAATGWNPPNPAFGGEGLHGFLATLPPDGSPHGEAFHYVSPNSDLLGWIIERAAGLPFPQLLSECVWQPMGAKHDAYVTVDAHGASRTAGGICMTLRDLARFADMVRLMGSANSQQIVPAQWISDMWQKGDPAAWQKGDMVNLFPNGRYRSQWYVADEKSSVLCAIGIHGQWIYIEPAAELVIVKQSSQKHPSDIEMDLLTFALFKAISRSFQ